MRGLELTFNFEKFVFVCRKVASYQLFRDITLSSDEARKLNKRKTPIAQFIVQPQLTTSWGGASIYDSSIQPQNMRTPSWEAVSTLQRPSVVEEEVKAMKARQEEVKRSQEEVKVVKEEVKIDIKLLEVK
jgi:hypothetical protein